MPSFEKRKKDFLGKKDKSNKQSWDRKIQRLCDKINNKKEDYTTSSCSGRVVLIKDNKKKKSGLFVYRTHDALRFTDFVRVLKDISGKYKGRVIFKQEPCILHVACDSLENSQKLLDYAKSSGWKKSGIISSRNRYVVEIGSTEYLAFPILDKGKVLVDENFLKIIVRESNKKLKNSLEKIKKLEKQF